MRTVTRWAGALVLATLPACGSDATGSGGSGLQGTWRASPADAGTHFTFAEHGGTRSIDFVNSFGATVTLTVGATTFSLTVAVPILGSDTRSGTYRSTDDSLVIVDAATNDTLAFGYTIANTTLTIVHTAGGGAWDFGDPPGDEPADVSGVFTRR